MSCLICNSETYLFLDLGRQPLANKYPESPSVKETSVALQGLFCKICGTVQLPKESIVPRANLFAEYYYASSVMAGLKKHFEEYAAFLKDKYGADATVVEIGSNDGVLLRPLKKLGLTAIGVEPAGNMAKAANKEGLPTIESFWNAAAVSEIHKRLGQVDVIVANNIFTHIDNVREFVECVQAALTDEGTFIIEVEYLGDIIKDLQFERFYSDHTYYFTLDALQNIFRLYNMVVTHVVPITTHSGSIRVFVQKNATKAIPSSAVAALLEQERSKGLTTFAAYKEYAQRVAHVGGALVEMLQKLKQEGALIAGYGAPARLTTISNYLRIGPSTITYIVDESPLKAGRLVPGMHIPIVRQERLRQDPPDVLVVFAWNYIEEIKRNNLFLKGKTRLIVPIPPHEVAW